MNSKKAYEFALVHGPSKDTREIACEDSKYAYWYARDIDKCSRDDTREATYKDPYYAHLYARDIDKKPRNDTRKAACEDPKYAYMYAKDVDKGFHEDTWEATKNTEFEEKYNKFLNQIEKDKII